mmetsp:Transcript_29539/g.97985  ORF Transcript_29539/g.97985 Transcript_29539/m.97985 type:complete len:356 (-) Transcript_29539:387-1454(-)
MVGDEEDEHQNAPVPEVGEGLRANLRGCARALNVRCRTHPLLRCEAGGELDEIETFLLPFEDVVKEEEELRHVSEHFARVDDEEDGRRHEDDVGGQDHAADGDDDCPQDNDAVRVRAPLPPRGHATQKDVVHALGLKVVLVLPLTAAEVEVSEKEPGDDEIDEYFRDARGHRRPLLGDVAPGPRVWRVGEEALYHDRVHVEELHNLDDPLPGDHDILGEPRRPAEHVVALLRDGPRAAAAEPRHEHRDVLRRHRRLRRVQTRRAVVVGDGLEGDLLHELKPHLVRKARDGPPNRKRRKIAVLVFHQHLLPVHLPALDGVIRIHINEEKGQNLRGAWENIVHLRCPAEVEVWRAWK